MEKRGQRADCGRNGRDDGERSRGADAWECRIIECQHGDEAQRREGGIGTNGGRSGAVEASGGSKGGEGAKKMRGMEKGKNWKREDRQTPENEMDEHEHLLQGTGEEAMTMLNEAVVTPGHDTTAIKEMIVAAAAAELDEKMIGGDNDDRNGGSTMGRENDDDECDGGDGRENDDDGGSTTGRENDDGERDGGDGRENDDDDRSGGDSRKRWENGNGAR